MNFIVNVKEFYSASNIVGVTVTVVRPSGTNVTGTTDASGNVTLTFNPSSAENVILTIAKTNYLGQSIDYPSIASGSSNVTVNTFVVDEVVEVAGLSVDDMAPVANAELVVDVSMLSVEAFYSPPETEVDFARLTFESALLYTILVQTNTGVPIEGALVRITSSGGAIYLGETGPDGTFQTPLSTGSIHVTFSPYTAFDGSLSFATVATPYVVTITVPPCINRYPSNENNFIRWYQTSGLSLPLPLLINNCSNPDEVLRTPVPKRYEQLCRTYYPVMVPGEEVVFQVNFNEPIADPGGLKLAIVQFSHTFEDDAGVVDTVAIGSGFNIVGTFTVPTLHDGLFKLVIYNPSGNQVKYISNEIRVINSNADQETITLKYRNRSDTFHFSYNDEDFYNTLRVHVNKIDEQIEHQFKQYEEVTTGYFQNNRVKTSLADTFESYFFDESAHRAMGVVLNHSKIFINDREYKIKASQGYKINKDLRYSLSRGVFEMFDQEFNQIDKGC